MDRDPSRELPWRRWPYPQKLYNPGKCQYCVLFATILWKKSGELGQFKFVKISTTSATCMHCHIDIVHSILHGIACMFMLVCSFSVPWWAVIITRHCVSKTLFVRPYLSYFTHVYRCLIKPNNAEISPSGYITLLWSSDITNKYLLTQILN